MRIRVETCHPFALWRWSCRPIDLIPKTKSPTTIPNSLWFFLVESNPTFWPTNPTCSLRSWLDDLGVPIGWSCSPWKSYSINRSYTISIYSVYIIYIYYIYIIYIYYIYIYIMYIYIMYIYIMYLYIYIYIMYIYYYIWCDIYIYIWCDIYIYTYDVIYIYRGYLTMVYPHSWTKPHGFACFELRSRHVWRSSLWGDLAEIQMVKIPSGKHTKNYGKSPCLMGKIHYKWPFSIANC